MEQSIDGKMTDNESLTTGKIRLKFVFTGIVVTIVAILYLFSRYHYLLFHSIAEIFSIVIAGGVFMIAWNSRRQIEEPFLVYIGIAYLFIGILDLFHTLSYKGMAIFTDYDFYANQLWIGARYMESLSLLFFLLVLGTKKQFAFRSVFAIYLLITGLLLGSVFHWKVFPICFIDGQGLTPFKVISEYIISIILLLSLAVLHQKRRHFDRYIHRLLTGSIVLTILGELAFTFYISNYGFSNLVGHFLKIGSFYLIYKAVIETGLAKPYSLIFKELKESESNLKDTIQKQEETQRKLLHEIEVRQRTENELNASLKEKERLLSEIHHRVKNSLSIVSSLLSLQSMKADDPQTRKILDDSQTRVQSVALVHKFLYQSESFRDINVKNYLENLVSAISRTYHSAAEAVTIDMEIEELQLDAKISSTLGLIVNELVTNAMKYAFPENQKGVIAVTLYQMESGEMELTIKDNGVGIPDGLDWNRTDSLGLSLVKSLAEDQLEGSFSVEKNQGTAFTVQFRIDTH